MATYRQKLVASKLFENGGNISKSMRESGYSSAMAKNPHKLTSSRGWQELMDVYLPIDFLLGKHRELFDARKSVGIKKQCIIVQDYSTITKSLKIAYKARGFYKTKSRCNFLSLEQHRNVAASELN